MMYAFLAVLILHLSACKASDPCPPKDKLAPCTCTQISVENLQSSTVTTLLPATSPLPRRKRDTPITPMHIDSQFLPNGTFYTVVYCNAPKSFKALDEIVSSTLNRKLVDKLVVSNVPPAKDNTLSRLPGGWLKKVRVRQFQILNTKLFGNFIWFGTPFAGQESSLLWFSAHNCSLYGSLTYDTADTVNTKGLNLLPYIQGIDLSNNFLTNILAVSFRHPPKNLTTVILSHNSIKTIQGSTFHHTALLSHVDLSHNQLETVHRSVFASPAKKLEYMDLSWNSLTTINQDFFTNMPSLKVVNVSHNFLYTLPAKPWSLAWKQLTYVNVAGNFVACNCDLLWLLPILLPPGKNSDATRAPAPLPGQTIIGNCIKTTEPHLIGLKYDLASLRRDNLNC